MLRLTADKTTITTKQEISSELRSFIFELEALAPMFTRAKSNNHSREVLATVLQQITTAMGKLAAAGRSKVTHDHDNGRGLRRLTLHLRVIQKRQARTEKIAKLKVAREKLDATLNTFTKALESYPSTGGGDGREEAGKSEAVELDKELAEVDELRKALA